MRTQETIALKIVHYLLSEGFAELWAEHCSGGSSRLMRGQTDPTEIDPGIPTPQQATEYIDSCQADDAIQTACWAFGEAAHQRLWRIMGRTKAGRETPNSAIEDLAFSVRWHDGKQVDAISLAAWFSEPIPGSNLPPKVPATDEIRREYNALVTRHTSSDYHSLKASAKRRLKQHIARLESTYQF